MKVLSTQHRDKLEAGLRHSLRSPLKKYKRGHFAALSLRTGRRVACQVARPAGRGLPALPFFV